MASSARDLSADFIVLDPQQGAAPVTRTDSLYEELDARFDGFRDHWLMAVHAFDAGWPTWEVHPAGDEVVALVSGSATLLLDTNDGEESVALTQPGSYVIVPRGVWHTARIGHSARMLFLTPGEGTENRPR